MGFFFFARLLGFLAKEKVFPLSRLFSVLARNALASFFRTKALTSRAEVPQYLREGADGVVGRDDVVHVHAHATEGAGTARSGKLQGA